MQYDQGPAVLESEYNASPVTCLWRGTFKSTGSINLLDNPFNYKIIEIIYSKNGEESGYMMSMHISKYEIDYARNNNKKFSCIIDGNFYNRFYFSETQCIVDSINTDAKVSLLAINGIR